MHKHLIGLILLLFIFSACQPAVTPGPAVKKPTKPPATKSAPAVDVPASGGGAAAVPVLTRDSLNTVPPQDIIQEIGYFGGAGGGGDICYDADKSGPTFWYLSQYSSELMEYTGATVCNLQPGERVNVRVEKPNGKVLDSHVTAEAGTSTSAFASFAYLPLADDPAGTYTFTFSGSGWSLDYTHQVIEPKSARLYEYKSNLYFLGFARNEKVRLLVYVPFEDPVTRIDKSKFQGWTEVQVDANGRKRLELRMKSASYVAIGKKSGEVNSRLADPMYIWEPFSVYCQGLAEPLGLAAQDYAEVLVDSLPVYEFNDASGHWKQTGEFQIDKGTIVQINSNVKCGDDSYLWTIICNDAYCGQVVPESGPGGPYLRPVDSLAAAASTSGGSEIPACPGTQPTRLQVGMNAEVTTSGLAPQLSLRAGASMSSDKVHVIAAGRDMVILKGPVCADNSYWWFIRSEQGFEGWAREGDNEDYWIDPLP